MSSSQLTKSIIFQRGRYTTNQTIFQIPIGQDHPWHCGFCRRRVHTICPGSSERREKGCRSDPQEWQLHRGYDRLVQVFYNACGPRCQGTTEPVFGVESQIFPGFCFQETPGSEGRRPGAGHNPWPVATSAGLGGSLQCDLWSFGVRDGGGGGHGQWRSSQCQRDDIGADAACRIFLRMMVIKSLVNVAQW